MIKNNKLQEYVPMVKFLGEALGPHVEIVLHDLSDLDNSIVVIENNQISERAVGGPATDLLLKVLKKSEIMMGADFITNCQGYSKKGKILKSSTFLIKDENDKKIGALCINLDISSFVQAKSELDKIINHPFQDAGKQNIGEISEKLDHSIGDLTDNAIQAILIKTNIPPERMSSEEKINIISELNKDGVFLLKGAVSEIAGHLKISEATVYRYLNKLK